MPNPKVVRLRACQLLVHTMRGDQAGLAMVYETAMTELDISVAAVNNEILALVATHGDQALLDRLHNELMQITHQLDQEPPQ